MNKKTLNKVMEVGLALSLGLSTLLMPASSEAASVNIKKTSTTIPTIFLHGLNGTDGSMSRMLEGLTGHKTSRYKTARVNGSKMKLGYDGQEKTYIVNKNLDITEVDFSDKPHKKGYVKVLFLNNKGNWSYQTTYLNEALKEITKDYKTQTVNLVGHSMGGVTSALYAFENYNRKLISPYAKDVYQVNKLVTVGSPFHGSKKGLKNGKVGQIGEGIIENLLNGGSEVKQRLGAKNMNFNPKMKTLSIASKSDEWVDVSSAFALENYMSSKMLTKKYSTGRHSEMTYSKETLSEIKKFL